MTQATPAQLLTLRQQLTQAVMNHDITAASQLLANIPPAGDHQLDQIAAKLYMATQNWSSAAVILPRLLAKNTSDLAIGTQLNLARNLAFTQQHRPELYETLVHTPAQGNHALHRLPSGQLTVARSRPNDQPLLLCTGHIPDLAARQALAALSEALQKGNALALNGTGDGYLLAQLAKAPTPLPMNQCSTVHIFEPEPELIMQTMMIHDYTGPTGPLQQQRFLWHVGPSWRASYENVMLTGSGTLPEPTTIAQTSGDPHQLKALLASVQAKAQQQGNRIKQSINDYYQSYTLKQFKSLCSNNPPRQPRVLLVTSRFTTVLQHETRRIAQAFQTIGWHTHIVIEPQDHHRLLTGAFEANINHFKPDLLFTLDHLRHEQGNNIHPNLPYCCWVQDLLPNITSTQAGQSLADRDWVISFCTPLLTDRYGYDKHRCIDAPIMMASEPALPATWQSDGHDLAYVSNLSQDSDELITQTLDHVFIDDQPLLRACCQLMVNHYKQGNSLPSKTDIGRLIAPLLKEHFAAMRHEINMDAATMHIIDRLWNPLNIGLYRQQALHWIAQIADEQNLSLAIFGRGWKNHPRFAKYAKGIITPGKPLQQLVRSTKINLNLEPYPCTTHVRLLDGLTAGGFYLVRHHPANTLLPQLAAFINQHAPNAINDKQALAITPNEHLPTLRDLLTRTAGVSYDHPPDVVAQMRCYQNASVMHNDQPLLPNLDDITFNDFQSCRQRITQYINDAATRKTIRDKQHKDVASRLTLHQGLSRIIKHMHDTAVLVNRDHKITKNCNAMSA